MIYSKKLKLPSNPFKNWEDFYKLDLFNLFRGNADDKASDKIYLYPTSYLTDETMAAFAAHAIKPIYIVLFKDNFTVPFDKEIVNDSRLIHRDIEKDPATNQWNKVYCGINWEIFNSSTFTWWDMSALNEVPPSDEDAIYRVQRDQARLGKPVWFNGVHYSPTNRRRQLGILDGSVKLAETQIAQCTPHLVRTDIPHMVYYHANNIGVRYSISIRIDESEVNSWQEALDMFRPLYDE